MALTPICSSYIDPLISIINGLLESLSSNDLFLIILYYRSRARITFKAFKLNWSMCHWEEVKDLRDLLPLLGFNSFVFFSVRDLPHLGRSLLYSLVDDNCSNSSIVFASNDVLDLASDDCIIFDLKNGNVRPLEFGPKL